MKIYKPQQQVDGRFNNGEILEKKPVGFPLDRGTQRPYSNLFYWSRAWAETESTIPEHPHKGFEIVTFVLKNSIEHYDNQNAKWIGLQEGDLQIMQAGSGLTHAELMKKGAMIFQIWFDPGLDQSLREKPYYKDFRKEQIPVIKTDFLDILHYTANDSPVQFKTEGVDIRRMQFSGKTKYDLKVNNILSVYIIGGNLEIGGALMEPNDFFILKGNEMIEITGHESTDLFILETPIKPGYETYAGKNRLSDVELES